MELKVKEMQMIQTQRFVVNKTNKGKKIDIEVTKKKKPEVRKNHCTFEKKSRIRRAHTVTKKNNQIKPKTKNKHKYLNKIKFNTSSVLGEATLKVEGIALALMAGTRISVNAIAKSYNMYMVIQIRPK